MAFWDYYFVIGCVFSGYVLGRMHEQGHEHWKNTAVAVLAGLLWPASLAYGVYLAHFKRS
jgi:hypothetical protein